MATRYQCPCCNYYTLDERASYDICPICNWEDDGTTEPDKVSGPNHTTLARARENFIDHGDMYELEHRLRSYPSWYNRRKALSNAMMEVLSNSDSVEEFDFDNLLEQYNEELGQYLDRYSNFIEEYNEYLSRISSGETSAVVDGLLGLVFHCEDLEFAQCQCFSLVKHKDYNVRGIAILCFGHLARIHGSITTEWVLPYIMSALKDDSKFVRDHAVSALEDIEMFLDNR